MSGNIKSTLVGFKPLIGREFDDPLIQQNLSNMFNDIIKQEDGSIGFKVRIISYRLNFRVVSLECRSSLVL